MIDKKRGLIVFGDHTKCFKFINFAFAPGADGIKVLEPRRPINEVSLSMRAKHCGCLIEAIHDIFLS